MLKRLKTQLQRNTRTTVTCFALLIIALSLLLLSKDATAQDGEFVYLPIISTQGVNDG